MTGQKERVYSEGQNSNDSSLLKAIVEIQAFFFAFQSSCVKKHHVRNFVTGQMKEEESVCQNFITRETKQLFSQCLYPENREKLATRQPRNNDHLCSAEINFISTAARRLAHR
jgi:hypothetical protein